MNTYVNEGDWIRYIDATDAQVRWGGNNDPRGVLKEGGLYTVKRVEIHKSHTKLFLDGYPNLRFNSVHFEPS